jgi:hypothetical protein
MSYLNIPEEMRLYNQWVLWRFEDRNSVKPTKVPYCSLTGKMASVTNPHTWVSFDQAIQAMEASNQYDGIGFVLTKEDPFAFVDLDDTKENQSELDRQIKIFKEFDSYAEKSPSGKGLHIIVKGALESGRRRSSIEIYSSARYMTMTGDVYRQSPIKDCNETLNILWQQMSEGGNAAQIYMGCAEASESDEVIIDRATRAANGQKFADLNAGNWQDHYPSQSEADFAFVDIVAFYTQNMAQIARLFRASGLGNRDKAKRNDYVKYMLNRCFDRMLPPVDIDGLQNQLQASMEANKQKEVLQTPSLLNELPQPSEIKEPEIKPENSIYSVPPGLVGEIAKFIFAQAPRPVPEIALAGALGMVAGIVGRSYNVSATGLNQYILLLAPTGTGKEAIASGVDKLFASVLSTVPASVDFIGPAEIASSQAVIKYMSKGPTSFVSLVGEFGIYLQQMASRNAPPHLLGLRRFLLDAYNKSGEGKVLRPSIYSDKDKNTNAIIAPAFSLLGESTPEKFYEGLDEGLISEGLLPRFTTIEYHGKRPPLNPTHSQATPSFELIERLSTLCAHSLMLNSQHKAIKVEFEPDAKAMFNKFDKHCDLQINTSEVEVSRHLWNRAHMKAMKLAALIAVGNNPYDPIINMEIGEWATNIIVADVRNLLDRFNAGEIGVNNDELLQLNKVSSTIEEFLKSSWPEVSKTAGENCGNLHENKIVPYAFIQRKLASIAIFRKDRIGSSASIKRALNTLIERGDLQEISRAVLSKDYNTTVRAFMVSNFGNFNL